MRRNGAAWDYGDLTPPDDFPCTIECKHERPAKLLNSILNGTDHKNTPLGWWAQARSDAERCRKETGGVVFPLVVYKIDRQPPRMLMEIEFLDAMRVKIKRIDVRLDVACFSIVNVDEFFEKVSKQMFLRGTKAIVPSFLLESA